MSGGVDSSVSALLLKHAGYDVTGVFVKVWQPEDSECTWKDERRDAMRVAAKLDIPFLTLDSSFEYKQEVVDYMIREYREGRTPNPDVMCNRHIKFGSLLREALARGIDFVATGHYAQNINNTLVEGTDKNKDQSYFLWTLTKQDLEHVLFPVGHLQKPEVRKIAEKHKLPVFDKKDSQGICFLGHVDMKAFLKEYIKTEKGKVLDMKGEVIGEHDGALLYTIGERRGFTLTVSHPDEKPHFVISKNIENNTITVAEYSSELISTLPTTLKMADVVWSNHAPSPDKVYSARLRYRQEKQLCKIDGDIVTFEKPQKAITSGQSLVIYDGEICLGGGIIV